MTNTIECSKGDGCVECKAIVAIPAHNEAERIEKCLAALAVQRDRYGSPIPRGSFEILVFSNNGTDKTGELIRELAVRVPHAIRLVEESLPPEHRNAGLARKRAMDLASDILSKDGPSGVILTTDADSIVSPTWFATIMQEIACGADCVAGYIDADPLEIIDLGPAFLARGRMEDSYLRLIAEIYAHCDPRPHDPWPNHRVSSGASLAVTLGAYRAIGGLPSQAVGEDMALTEALDNAGFNVRHSMDVCVWTSCRLYGRAQGGAADTMRYRHAFPDAPCDEELEPALQATRRAIHRGLLRHFRNGTGQQHEQKSWIRALGLEAITALRAGSFSIAWREICETIPTLRRGKALRPSDLARQIAIAKMVVKHLRLAPSRQLSAPTGKSHPEGLSEPAEPA